MENPDVEMEMKLTNETMTLKYKVSNAGEDNARAVEFKALTEILLGDDVCDICAECEEGVAG